MNRSSSWCCGLLSGRYTRETTFAENDHRNYNRDGSAFDVGETFSGVDYETGVDAAQRFSALAREAGLEPATAALAWVAQQPGVTTVIPGARTVAQAVSNADAAALLDAEAQDRPFEDLGFEIDGFDLQTFDELVRDDYDRRLRADIHPLW